MGCAFYVGGLTTQLVTIRPRGPVHLCEFVCECVCLMPVPFNLRQSTLLHLLNHGYTDIQELIELTGYKKSSIYRHMKNFEANGQLDLKRSRERKRKLGVMQIHQIVAWAKENPKSSAADLAKKFFSESNIQVHPKTLLRTLKSIDFIKRRATRSPLLTDSRKQVRINWCEQHLNFNFDNVIFTDQCAFRLYSNYIKVWTFRHGETLFQRPPYNPQVMVYGAISKLGKVCIVIKQGSYNSSFHCELLEQQVLPIAIELFPNGFVLQQDNAPVHTSSITQTFIDQNQIATVSWPPYSPDLNIIENIWWIMKADSNSLRHSSANLAQR